MVGMLLIIDCTECLHGSIGNLQLLYIVIVIVCAFVLLFIKAFNHWMKAAGKASLSNTKAKSTKIGLKETESDKACTHVIRKKSY